MERTFAPSPATQELFELAEALPEGPQDIVFYTRRRETLDHFARWSGKKPESIAKRNELPNDGDRPIPVGTPITISLAAEGLDRFESERRIWHDAYQRAFYTKNTVVELQRYRVKSGDSLWKIARMGDTPVPIWLLEKLNPGRDLSVLQVGMILQVPMVVAIGGSPAKPTAETPSAKVTPSAQPPKAASVKAKTANPPAPSKPDKTTAAVKAAPRKAAPAPSSSLGDGATGKDMTPIDSSGLRIKVQPHEFLSHYASWADLQVQAILAANAIEHADRIHVGQTLLLPIADNRVASFYQKRRAHLYSKGVPDEIAEEQARGAWTTHKVAPGDTAWEIAVKKHGVPVAEVEALNPGVDLSRLHPGMLLRVPLRGTTP